MRFRLDSFGGLLVDWVAIAGVFAFSFSFRFALLCFVSAGMEGEG